ncbi:Hsp20/alpha crystallin family protein [Phenylobacterium sp. J367]|uniref:Hsp20/alpha crystallin family protein n=1 Tax=Phenylobacterium sp. J367 TaxID=2898435 RepID=UPI002151E62E|nr:Hsp20/alpha crystallin family protein [Phenylobacterium sp. J367]MCR5881061.1 Hsp20/alpha crystallin family protein [Phenylobacterium sp. J367]
MTVTDKDLIPSIQRNAAAAFAPLQREFNRLFDELGEGWNAIAEIRPTPRMDVVDTAAGLEISVELPGMTRDQVKITVQDDMLTISGEKTASRETADKAYRLLERSYGAFSRSVYLPRSLDAGGIAATMADGVLKIAIPKRPGAESKTIEIQSK